MILPLIAQSTAELNIRDVVLIPFGIAIFATFIAWWAGLVVTRRVMFQQAKQQSIGCLTSLLVIRFPSGDPQVDTERLNAGFHAIADGILQLQHQGHTEAAAEMSVAIRESRTVMQSGLDKYHRIGDQSLEGRSIYYDWTGEQIEELFYALMEARPNQWVVFFGSLKRQPPTSSKLNKDFTVAYFNYRRNLPLVRGDRE